MKGKQAEYQPPQGLHDDAIRLAQRLTPYALGVY